MNADASIKTADLAKQMEISVPQLIVMGAKCVGQLEEIWPTMAQALAETLKTMAGNVPQARASESPPLEPVLPAVTEARLTDAERDENEILDKLVRGEFWGARRIETTHFVRRSMRRRPGAEEAVERLLSMGLLEHGKNERVKSGGQAISLKSSRKQEITRRVSAWRAQSAA